MKPVHYAGCLIGVAAAIAILAVVGVRWSTIGIALAVLACPLVMFVMMRTLMSTRTAARSDEQAGHNPT